MALIPPGRCALLAALMLALAWSSVGRAHVRSESFSQWDYQEGVLKGRFTVMARDATRISGAGPEQAERVANYLAETVEAFDTSDRCVGLDTLRPVDARPGYLQFVGRWRCPGPPQQIVIRSFFDLAAEHVHFATVELNGRSEQRVLTPEHSAWQLANPVRTTAARNAFAPFLELGFRHIVSGADHLLFLLMILIACHRLRDVVWAVTGFTLGHSLTLGFAASGVLEPNLPAVEATIGLTIALVAVERAAPDARHPWLLAAGCAAPLVLLAGLSSRLGGPAPGLLTALALFVLCYLMLARGSGAASPFKLLVTAMFGLVHGMGFASAFTSLPMESDAWLWPLAGFNLGVELGQLAVVGAMGAAVLALRRWPDLARWSTDLAGAAACATGVYWFVSRGFS